MNRQGRRAAAAAAAAATPVAREAAAGGGGNGASAGGTSATDVETSAGAGGNAGSAGGWKRKFGNRQRRGRRHHCRRLGRSVEPHARSVRSCRPRPVSPPGTGADREWLGR